jgi:hypothetical protein
LMFMKPMLSTRRYLSRKGVHGNKFEGKSAREKLESK